MNHTSYRLGDFCKMRYGKMPPKDILADEGFPIFSGYRITGYAKEYLYEEPKVIVVARGVGGTGDVKLSPEKSWITNLSIVLEHDEHVVNKQFLFYKLGHEPLKEKLNTGAAQAQITIDSLSSYRLALPELSIQTRIASILSAYDDLIKNNRRRIQLLEQLARLLYKEWFVRLRFPGHEGVKVKDGVPEGWESKQVKSVLKSVKRPRKIKKEDFLKEGLIPCIDQSQEFVGGYTDDTEAVVDLGQPVIVFGDHTRILKFINFPFACGADGTQLIVSNNGAMSQEFLYFALDVVDLQQIKSLRDHYRCLSKARDLLLPRLMSGEVAI